MAELMELRRYAFFNEFSDSQLDDLASIAMSSDWMEGETLFRKGATASNLYILKKGTVLLWFMGGRSFPIRTAGSAIGWSALVSPFQYTASARCLTDTDLYQIPSASIYDLLRMDTNFGRLLMTKIARVMQERKRYRWPRK